MGDESSRTRRRVLQAIGSTAVAGLAGCASSDPSNSTPQSTGTSTTAATTGTTTTTATETSTETTTDEPTSTEHTHDHSGEKPESVQFAQNPRAVHPTLVEATSVPSDEVLIGLRLEDSSLPFETEVYHAPTDAEVQATETYGTQSLGRVGLVPDSPRTLDTVDTDREDVHYATTRVGEPLTVTLVARHDGETFEWSAWDRTGYPYAGFNEDNRALKVHCYCGGMIYTAPGGGTWARVIQVTPTERVDPGTTVVLNWTSSRT